ncbi:LCP family protein [bacterium]|nr:LCP family protein [bacterium]
MAGTGDGSEFEGGLTPDLDWIPIKDASLRKVASRSGKRSTNYRKRLDMWRRRRRFKIIALLVMYSMLFFIVFSASLVAFVGIGLSEEQHKSLKTYFSHKLYGAAKKEPALPKLFDDKRDIHILIVGLDKEPPHRSDTVIVVHMDLVSLETRMLSIPRDLRVTMLTKSGRRAKEKLAHTYVYGDIGGVRFAVEHLLGISIDNYVLISIEGLVSFIDELGGIEIDVEKNMRYRDRAQDLNIDLRKGLQVLNGEDAVDYGRFRKDIEGDNGRMRRQQQLIKAILIEARKPTNIRNIGTLLNLFYETVETDFLLGQFLGFKDEINDFTPDKIKSMTLFTDSMIIEGISYQFVTDKDLEEARDFLLDLSPEPPPGDETDEEDQGGTDSVYAES